MDITYTMIGADGLHYGPVNLEQLKGWIAEGRIMPETKVLRSDTQSWLPAANYVELNLATNGSPAHFGPAPGGKPDESGGRGLQSGTRASYQFGRALVFLDRRFVAREHRHAGFGHRPRFCDRDAGDQRYIERARQPVRRERQCQRGH